MKERIVHLETIVNKIGDLEEKIEELIKRGMFIWYTVHVCIYDSLHRVVRLNP